MIKSDATNAGAPSPEEGDPSAVFDFLAGAARRAECALARRCFVLAEEFLRPVPPRLVAVRSLPGTKKARLWRGA